MKKEFLIIGNLKMKMITSDMSKYLKTINKKIDNQNVVICPTSIYVPYFLKQKYKVGLQNVFFRSEGAYTGEVSPKQAASMGIEYIIIGHSDRRIYFNETDSDINKKILECLKYDLKVILCIGETNEEKNMLKTTRILKKQLTIALRNVENFDNIYVVYEPVWAIGTKIIPEIKDIKEAILYIKEIVKNNFNFNNIKVLYGGSIDKNNIKKIKEISELSGIMVGDNSTIEEEFINIIEEIA
ncbi:MAG: triose-phosphate isomerase [Bacilli bacterium]|nr:triose-phosphate isomerase [Bacilli bacterium]